MKHGRGSPEKKDDNRDLVGPIEVSMSELDEQESGDHQIHQGLASDESRNAPEWWRYS